MPNIPGSTGANVTSREGSWVDDCVGSGLGVADGVVDSDGATVGDGDGSGTASSDEQAASIRPEAIRTVT
jgi:hypothetical protein